MLADCKYGKKRSFRRVSYNEARTNQETKGTKRPNGT
jgi:hypothetical protein